MIFGIIALIVIVLIVLWGVSAYNGLVTLRNRVKNGWAQIDVQLKQRADLIPNLVETVKGYAAHESQVFTQVTQARASALQAAQSGDVAQRIQAENQLSRAIMNLQAVAEAYPQLQANQNFLDPAGPKLKALEEKNRLRPPSSITMWCRSTTPRSRSCRPTSSPDCSTSSRRRTSRSTKRTVRLRKSSSERFHTAFPYKRRGALTGWILRRYSLFVYTVCRLLADCLHRGSRENL